MRYIHIEAEVRSKFIETDIGRDFHTEEGVPDRVDGIIAGRDDGYSGAGAVLHAVRLCCQQLYAAGNGK